MSKFIFLGILVFVSFIALSSQQSVSFGAWFGIPITNNELIGLTIRGMNHMNTQWRISPGYRFDKFLGTPEKQVLFGNAYRANVSMTNARWGPLRCYYQFFYWPKSTPFYTAPNEKNYFKIACDDRRTFEFTITR